MIVGNNPLDMDRSDCRLLNLQLWQLGNVSLPAARLTLDQSALTNVGRN